MKKSLLNFAAFIARILPGSLKNRLYHLGPFTKLIRKSLNQAAPSGPTKVKIAAGILEGEDFYLDLQSEKDYWLGTYEADFQEVLKKLVKSGMVVYDIGANVGYITVILGKLVGPQGQVVSFEALLENQERLQKNIDLNQSLSNFKLISKAVTDKSGEAQFLIHPSDDMGKVAGSAGRDAEYTESISVKTISVDDFVYQDSQTPPNIIKLDIEGGEVLALPGMKRLLSEAKPIMMIEMHGPESAKSVFHALTLANYSIHSMQPEMPMVNSVEQLDWKAYLIGLPPR